MSDSLDLKRKRSAVADKRFAKIRRDVADMNAPPQMALWRAMLIERLHENGFEMESLEEDEEGEEQLEAILERAAEGSTSYTPYIDVNAIENALKSITPAKDIEPAVLKALAIMVAYLKKSGAGQHELIDDPDSKKRLKRLLKAAETLPETALKGTRRSHLRIVYDVMTYAEDEVLGDAGLAIEMFELILEEAQLAGLLPK